MEFCYNSIFIILSLVSLSIAEKLTISSSSTIKALSDPELHKRVINQYNPELRAEMYKAVKDVHIAVEKYQNFTEHPINILKLIKSLRTVAQLGSKSINFNTVLTKVGATWPKEEDLDGIYETIMKLQLMYDLPISELRHGKILGVEAAFKMDEFDILAMAKLAYLLQLRRTSTWWGMEYERQPNMTLESMNRLVDFYIEYLSNRGFYFMHQIQHEFGIPIENSLKRWKEAVKKGRPPTWTKGLKQNPKYDSLCRGETLGNVTDQKKLYCTYIEVLLPYNVYKEEVHNLDPKISLFLEVITKTEVKKLKQLAAPQLNSSEVIKDYNQMSVDTIRRSLVSWLTEDSSLVRRIDHRISLITGLSTTVSDHLSHAEYLQVANYGVGGYFNPHLDSYPPEKCDPTPDSYTCGSGVREATFMLYLSEVTAGGATVFTELNVHLEPRPGAAVFWYNTKRSGEVDPRTKHAGCPVLLGEKWVANKWIWSIGQTFRRPCGLSQYD